MAVAIPALIFLARMMAYTHFSDRDRLHVMVTSGHAAAGVAAPASSLLACEPSKEAHWSTWSQRLHVPHCDTVLASTKLDEQCEGTRTSDASAVYPVLFTGVGGNLPDATIDWFRKQKVVVARDSAIPSAEFGAMNWALAFGDWKVCEKSGGTPPFVWFFFVIPLKTNALFPD